MSRLFNSLVVFFRHLTYFQKVYLGSTGFIFMRLPIIEVIGKEKGFTRQRALARYINAYMESKHRGAQAILPDLEVSFSHMAKLEKERKKYSYLKPIAFIDCTDDSKEKALTNIIRAQGYMEEFSAVPVVWSDDSYYSSLDNARVLRFSSKADSPDNQVALNNYFDWLVHKRKVMGQLDVAIVGAGGHYGQGLLEKIMPEPHIQSVALYGSYARETEDGFATAEQGYSWEQVFRAKNLRRFRDSDRLKICKNLDELGRATEKADVIVYAAGGHIKIRGDSEEARRHRADVFQENVKGVVRIAEAVSSKSNANVLMVTNPPELLLKIWHSVAQKGQSQPARHWCPGAHGYRLADILFSQMTKRFTPHVAQLRSHMIQDSATLNHHMDMRLFGTHNSPIIDYDGCRVLIDEEGIFEHPEVRPSSHWHNLKEIFPYVNRPEVQSEIERDLLQEGPLTTEASRELGTGYVQTPGIAADALKRIAYFKQFPVASTASVWQSNGLYMQRPFQRAIRQGIFIPQLQLGNEEVRRRVEKQEEEQIQLLEAHGYKL